MIGLELGSVWRRLGAEVTVVEFLDRILPTNDGEVAKQFPRACSKSRVSAFKLGHKVTKVEKVGCAGVKATIEPAAGGDAETLQADVVLVAIGRRPYTERLGLEAAGVKLERAAWSSSTTISADQRARQSTRSATWCAGRCSPTRRRTRASRSRKSSPASMAM